MKLLPGEHEREFVIDDSVRTARGAYQVRGQQALLNPHREREVQIR